MSDRRSDLPANLDDLYRDLSFRDRVRLFSYAFRANDRLGQLGLHPGHLEAGAITEDLGLIRAFGSR